MKLSSGVQGRQSATPKSVRTYLVSSELKMKYLTIPPYGMSLVASCTIG